MEEIKAYKLTDGSIIERKDLAVKKQAEISIKEQLSDFFANHTLLSSNQCEELVELCFERKEELVKILNNG